MSEILPNHRGVDEQELVIAGTLLLSFLFLATLCVTLLARFTALMKICMGHDPAFADDVEGRCVSVLSLDRRPKSSTL